GLGSADLSYTVGPGMRALSLSRAMLLGLSAITLVAGLAAPRDAAAGTIKGTVVLKGTTPELKKLAVTIDQYVCGKEKNPEDLVLSPQGGMRGAVVWLDHPAAAAGGDGLPSRTTTAPTEGRGAHPGRRRVRAAGAPGRTLHPESLAGTARHDLEGRRGRRPGPDRRDRGDARPLAARESCEKRRPPTERRRP